MSLWNSTFFGNSKGDTNSSSSTTNNTTNVDKRQVVDNAGVGVSSDSSTVNVTSSDHESIKAAFDLAQTSSNNGLNSIQAAVKFAGDALKLSGTTTGNALKLAGEATSATASGVSSAYQTAQDSATGLRFVVGAGLVVAGIVALFLFGGHKKAAA